MCQLHAVRDRQHGVKEQNKDQRLHREQRKVFDDTRQRKNRVGFPHKESIVIVKCDRVQDEVADRRDRKTSPNHTYGGDLRPVIKQCKKLTTLNLN